MFLFWARFEHDFLILFLIFYLVKINKLIFFNLDTNVTFFNVKIDFLIIILIVPQPRQLFQLVG